MNPVSKAGSPATAEGRTDLLGIFLTLLVSSADANDKGSQIVGNSDMSTSRYLRQHLLRVFNTLR
jgi:hypothetical protein